MSVCPECGARSWDGEEHDYDCPFYAEESDFYDDEYDDELIESEYDDLDYAYDEDTEEEW